MKKFEKNCEHEMKEMKNMQGKMEGKMEEMQGEVKGEIKDVKGALEEMK